MLTIKLRDIQGVHPEFSRIERDLDLAPVGVPDQALIPKAMAVRINMLYPLVISRPDALCIGQTTLYRWLKTYMDPETPVQCIEWTGGRIKDCAYQLVLIERLVAPALAQITPQQVRDGDDADERENVRHCRPPCSLTRVRAIRTPPRCRSLTSPRSCADLKPPG